MGEWNTNKLDFKPLGCESVDWIQLAQDKDLRRALGITVMNLRIP
jgi:hypothetical protein